MNQKALIVGHATSNVCAQLHRALVQQGQLPAKSKERDCLTFLAAEHTAARIAERRTRIGTNVIILYRMRADAVDNVANSIIATKKPDEAITLIAIETIQAGSHVKNKYTGYYQTADAAIRLFPVIFTRNEIAANVPGSEVLAE